MSASYQGIVAVTGKAHCQRQFVFFIIRQLTLYFTDDESRQGFLMYASQVTSNRLGENIKIKFDGYLFFLDGPNSISQEGSLSIECNVHCFTWATSHEKVLKVPLFMTGVESNNFLWKIFSQPTQQGTIIFHRPLLGNKLMSSTVLAVVSVTFSPDSVICQGVITQSSKAINNDNL